MLARNKFVRFYFHPGEDGGSSGEGDAGDGGTGDSSGAGDADDGGDGSGGNSDLGALSGLIGEAFFVCLCSFLGRFRGWVYIFASATFEYVARFLVSGTGYF